MAGLNVAYMAWACGCTRLGICVRGCVHRQQRGRPSTGDASQALLLQPFTFDVTGTALLSSARTDDLYSTLLHFCLLLHAHRHARTQAYPFKTTSISFYSSQLADES